MKYKFLKKLASLAVIFIIAFSLCFGFAFSNVTASAEISTELQPDISQFNIEDYPTANYFDVTKLSSGATGSKIEAISNGLVNSVVVTFRAGLKVNTVATLAEICPEMQVGETYTLSYKCDYSEGGISVATGAWLSGEARVITQEDLEGKLSFLTQNKILGGATYSEIMINKGSTAYPYFPYFYSLYSSGYDDGLSEGENIGYEMGMEEGFLYGLEYAKFGFLVDCEVFFLLKNYGSTGGNYSYDSQVGEYFDGGFSLFQFKDELLDLIAPYTSFQSMSVTLRFSTPVTLGNFALSVFSDYLTAVYIDDNTDIFYAQLDASEAPYYNLSLDSFSQLSKDSLIYELGFEFSNGVNALSSSFFIPDVSYDAGYRQGYINGSSEQYYLGFDDGYNEANEFHKNSNDKAYNQGFNDGFISGKNTLDGDHLSTSVRSFIFSLFDAPVSTFTEVLDFEYEGFDVGGLVGFVFSLIVIGGVLKLVL